MPTLVDLDMNMMQGFRKTRCFSKEVKTERWLTETMADNTTKPAKSTEAFRLCFLILQEESQSTKYKLKYSLDLDCFETKRNVDDVFHKHSV